MGRSLQDAARLRRIAVATFAAALAAAALLRADLVVRRYFDTDETAHLHAALLAAHGNVPFRDFFENHGPAMPALLAGVVAGQKTPYAAALAGRALMSACWLGMLLLAARPRRGEDPLGGALTAVLLAFFGAFALKSVEVRPDVPAALLLCGALASAASGRPRSGLAAGFLLGLGAWFSPKIVFAGAGLLAASALRRGREGGRREAGRFLARAAAGAAVPAFAGLSVFAACGALRPLWNCYVVFNVLFRRAALPWPTTLAPSLALDPLIWLLGLAGLWRWRRRPEEAGALALGLAGLVVVPSAYPQYLLFLAPPLAALASRALLDWIEAGPRPARRAALAALLLAAALARPAAAGLRLAREGNELQRERWACVERLTRSEERILDVWGGDSFHRPHAAWRWYLPEDVQAMFEPAPLERELVSALESPRTRGLVWCESCFERMPRAFVETARRLYVPAGCGRLWLRRELR